MAREHLIQIRVSDGEKATISRLAGGAGMSVSEWVRRLATDPTFSKPQVITVGADVLREARENPGRPFGCPVAGCDFGAHSPAARCPHHGRSVR